MSKLVQIRERLPRKTRSPEGLLEADASDVGQRPELVWEAAFWRSPNSPALCKNYLVAPTAVAARINQGDFRDQDRCWRWTQSHGSQPHALRYNTPVLAAAPDEGHEPLNFGVDGFEVIGNQGVYVLAGAIRVILHPEQCANCLDLEPEFASMPDEEEPTHVPLAVTAAVTARPWGCRWTLYIISLQQDRRHRLTL